MSSMDKYFGVESADHGFDDIGFAQPSGSISAIASATTQGPRFTGKLLITLGPTGSTQYLKKGQPFRVTNLDNVHNGLTRILKVVSATQVVVNKDYSTAGTGATSGVWDMKGGASNWDAFEPIGGNVTGSNLTITLWDDNKQGGNPSAIDYQQGVRYRFPGGIKTILLSSGGNLRLFRASSLRPKGATAQ